MSRPQSHRISPNRSSSSGSSTASSNASSNSSPKKRNSRKSSEKRRQKVSRQYSTKSNGSVGSSNDTELPLAFSGWIHVATSSRPNSKKRFKKRYCKLRDVVAKFYDNVGDKGADDDKHMIVRVAKLPEINQGIQLVNHKGKFISLYTENENDFDMWYTAFDEALKAAQRSKEVRQRSVQNLPTSKSHQHLSPQEMFDLLSRSTFYRILFPTHVNCL